MLELFQLPGGNSVAPDRVSSVQVVTPEAEPPMVVVVTKEGVRLVIENPGDYRDAVKMRDGLVQQFNDRIRAANAAKKP